jgi:hypothetical protein
MSDTCIKCGKPADTVPGHKQPICIECVFGVTGLIRWVEDMERQDALEDYCSSLARDGHNDWRLDPESGECVRGGEE